jgi:hypothetical protein
MPDATPSPFRPYLPYWVGVVFPVVIVAAIGFAYIFVINTTFQPVAVTLAATAGMGMVAGFTVRKALPRRAWIVKGAITLAALMVGLLMLGLITSGDSGIGPIDTAGRGPNWFGLLQVVIATGTAFLTLQAWRPRLVPRVTDPLAVDAENNPTPAPRPVAEPSRLAQIWEGWTRQWQRTRDSASARWQESAAGRSLRRASEGLEQARAWSQQEPETAVTTPAPAPAPAPASVAEPGLVERVRHRFSRPPTVAKTAVKRPRPQPRIKLIGAIEHRCPYCLEAVEPNDPRGIEVCEICHTFHHADCWAVTGMCQVPHHHTEIKVAD